MSRADERDWGKYFPRQWQCNKCGRIEHKPECPKCEQGYTMKRLYEGYIKEETT